MWVLCVLR